MNKHLAAFLQKHRLESENAKCFYGIFEGYPVKAYFAETGFSVNVSCKAWDAASSLQSYFKANARETRVKNFKVNMSFLYFSVTGLTMKSVCESLETALKSVTDQLRKHNIPAADVCMVCGEPLEDGVKVHVEAQFFPAHRECAEKFCAQRKENIAEAKQRPGNYFSGTLGAVCGALAGCVAWAIAYFLGYIVGAIAILVGVLASLFYDKCNGKNGAVKVIIVVLASLICIFFTMFCCYLISIKAMLAAEGISMNVMDAFLLLIEDPEVKRAMIADGVIALIFALLGCGYSVYSILRSHKVATSEARIEN